jgi:hypothetical protein
MSDPMAVEAARRKAFDQLYGPPTIPGGPPMMTEDLLRRLYENWVDGPGHLDEGDQHGHEYAAFRAGVASWLAWATMVASAGHPSGDLWARQLMDCPDPPLGDPQGGGHCGDPVCPNWRGDCARHNAARAGRGTATCSRHIAAATIMRDVLGLLDEPAGREAGPL